MAFSTVVKSKLVGDVTISGKDSAWKIDAKVESKGETEEITIELVADKPMTPPRFNVAIFTPQLDAHHLWHSSNIDRAKLFPEWKSKYTSSLAQDIPLYTFLNTKSNDQYCYKCKN